MSDQTRPTKRLTPQELAVRMAFWSEVSCHAVFLAASGKSKSGDTLADARREVTAQWLSQGRAVPV